jgi:hypothetical protein
MTAPRAGRFVADNTHHADYNSTVNSWVEQRTFVTQAPALLAKVYPEVRTSPYRNRISSVSVEFSMQ